MQWDDKCRFGNPMHRVGRLSGLCLITFGNPFTVSPVSPSLRKGVRGPYKLSLSGSQGASTVGVWRESAVKCVTTPSEVQCNRKIGPASSKEGRIA